MVRLLSEIVIIWWWRLPWPSLSYYETEDYPGSGVSAIIFSYNGPPNALTEIMLPADVAGAFPQKNFNNVVAITPSAPLLDANGAGTRVVLAKDAWGLWASGSGVESSREAFFQTYAFQPDYSDMHLALTGVTAIGLGPELEPSSRTPPSGVQPDLGTATFSLLGQ